MGQKREYDPNLSIDYKHQYMYLFRCPECADANVLMSLIRHKAECSKPETVFVFGPRLARAILLPVVERKEKEDNIGEGLVFSWDQLKQEFPEAAKTAETALGFLIQQRAEKEKLGVIGAGFDQFLAARIQSANKIRKTYTRQMTSTGELVAQLKLPGLESEESPAPLPARKPVQRDLFSKKVLVPRKPPVDSQPVPRKPAKNWDPDSAHWFANRPLTGTKGR